MQLSFLRRGLVLAAFALTTSMGAQAASVLQPSADVSVSELYGLYGFDSLTVNWYPESANVGLLQFDLQGVTSATRATLDLYQLHNAFAGSETGIFSLFVNTSPWVGVTTDWANRPTYAPTPAATITLASGDAYGNFRSFDVTAAVQNWISGTTPNYGFTLARTNAVNPFIFFAATESGPAFAPRLAISSVPESGTILLTLTGLACMGGMAWVRKNKQPQG